MQNPAIATSAEVKTWLIAFLPWPALMLE